MNVSQIISDMREIYRIKHYDFMGYTFRTVNDLSYHHIIKKSDGGPKTIENGALLVKDTSHPYLHIIEDREFEIYNYINNILLEINRQQKPPTKEQLLAIREALYEFEAKHKQDISSSGKLLIRRHYIDRRIEL